MLVQFNVTPERARGEARLFFTLHGGSAHYGKHVRIRAGGVAQWSRIRALTARGKAFLRAMKDRFVWRQAPRSSSKESATVARRGDYVYVTGGPYTSSNGQVDFVDEKGKRALVDFGGGRSGGLTWVALEHLYVPARAVVDRRKERV